MQRSLLPLALAALTATPALAQWTTASLSQARTDPAGVTVGDLVLFAGGRDGNTLLDTLDVYDSVADTWSDTTLPVGPQVGLAATAVGDLALFAGGAVAFGVGSKDVHVFDSQSLTWSSAPMLSEARIGVAATTVGSKAFFAGGGGIGFLSRTVDIYDASVGAPNDPAAWSTELLSLKRSAICAVTVGDLAIFAGGAGFQGVPYARVDIYDDSTGLWSTASLSSARSLGPTAGAVVGDRAYFAGGHNSFQGGPNMFDTVDVYDASMGPASNPAAWLSTALPMGPRGYLAATAVGNTVLIAGGFDTGFIVTDRVEVLDAATGQWKPSSTLSEARAELGVATIGGKALFAGGGTGPSVSAVVDIFETCPGGNPSTEVVRLGTPPNPNALLPGVTSGPVTGAVWDPVIDHSSFFPGALLDTMALAFSPAQINIDLVGVGTLLCNVGAPYILFTVSPGSAFSVPIPSNCSMVGLPLCAQGLSMDANTLLLTNALDITIGSF